jgi:vitamin B12 transporter
MTSRRTLIALVCLTTAGNAQLPDAVLPEVTVYSPRVANQSPAATFAMPVSALRFEPRVDLQSRNFAESQADVTIRGGIFENTGFSVGAVSLFDPQTGHYFAEIPVAPAMLGAPEIVTGVDLALKSINATAGAVAYQWRPIRTAGAASVGGGQYGLTQADFYQGYVFDTAGTGRRLAADVAWAHSDSDGSIRYGDHVLNRFNARVQLAGVGAQTDLFAGYQEKFFGWPNLYTPFNSNESENIHTLLVALNHRSELGAGDFTEMGAYYRRNQDDYAFDRFAPVGPIHPFQHTTWVRGAAAGGRLTAGETSWNFRAEVLADELESTSLTFGRYHTRAISKVVLAPERSWVLEPGASLRVKAGASYDDTNRGDGVISPLIEIAREEPGASAQRLYASYAQTTQLPTYTALNSNSAAGLFRGNQNLGRETSRNAEIGVSGKWADWTGQSAVFYRRDDDLVDWTFRRGVTARSANAVNIATTGIELVARRSWTVCDLVLGYTWLAKDADYRGALVDASFYALNYARHRFTAAIVARLTSQFEVRMDNEIRAQAANLLRTRGGNDPILSSLGVTYRPPAWRRVSLTVQADNLWDSNYQEVPAVPAARRQISADVAYVW